MNIIKHIGIYLLLIFSMLLFLSRCVLYKIRWSDEKAYRIFRKKNVPLKIYDTLMQGHHIHYAIAGNENLPTMVFIHGSPGSWYRFDRLIWDKDLLARYRFVIIDRPGFGHSDFGHPMHLDDQCDLIMPLLQRLKTTEPMYLCGHSYGGAVVAKLAAMEPALFKTLLIFAGAISPEQEKTETWRYMIDRKPLYWLVPGAYQASNTELLLLKGDLELLAPELKKITCPVKFVHGDRDNWVPIENIAYGKKMMINAASITADTIKGAGHILIRNRPFELKKILMELQ